MHKATVSANKPKSVIDALRREHTNMRSVMALIRSQLDVLERGKTANFVLLANALYYMRRFPDVIHHPKEDFIFGRLAEIDPAMQKEMESIRSQHHEIYELEDQLIELALNVPLPGTRARSRLVEIGYHYLQLQRDHSMREEQLLFPWADELLKPKDWAEVARRFKKIDDPLFGSHKGERYELLYEHLMRESTLS